MRVRDPTTGEELDVSAIQQADTGARGVNVLDTEFPPIGASHTTSVACKAKCYSQIGRPIIVILRALQHPPSRTS